ncbi:uncharacterized protein BO88DRAFT_417297 [Aspergillus vadensis CBS 113365]|uniref:Uncharacterized protein n=1 Tax=Aspergillus vadensis (strain CBS 113365 / IMI 142717 / IBT 24658) TaxID=1448311 RepID=A0A319BV12_ASPVC|nr:hypothetical protein BO88DRAFT_417297 [Aspergillus vadensis CBS 113365]PYH66958.1 hypothetical protein BO88DRAFT_417297 [Aspergillus vadensis CBS 113365]
MGQIYRSYIPVTLGWRWLEWVMLIVGGIVLALVLLFRPETYDNLILYWKASILRKETDDERYRAPMKINQKGLGQQLKTSVYRPFAMFYSELFYQPDVALSDHHLYCPLPFLRGIWPLRRANQPLLGCWTAKAYAGDKSTIAPEMRLWYTMLGGAVAVSISLFWMGWTSNPNISEWSPLVASAFFGYGITTIFIVAYMYLIDSYDT